MNHDAWRARLQDRTQRYAGRILDKHRSILIQADESYSARYDGQVAILTATNLLGRMTPAVAVDIPAVPVVRPLPWEGSDLRNLVLDHLRAVDPFVKFEARAPREDDYVIHLGPSGSKIVAHGSGWNAYLGPAPSPLEAVASPNPAGPALAAILSATHVFVHEFAPPTEASILNALTWTQDSVADDVHPLHADPALGTLWSVGAGSVGSAILYFLTLATRRFESCIFDMDSVEPENLDRSPVFLARHVGWSKVAAMEEYLSSVRVPVVKGVPDALDETILWRNRPSGVPDVLISAANERNVRQLIESGFPPIQIYATTGKNWQASVVRHIPFRDPCSCCLFDQAVRATTECANGKIEQERGTEHRDAALPFLSFAAGVMAAIEILKLSLPGFPFTTNRIVLYTRPSVRPVSAALVQRAGCICRHRSPEVHRQAIQETRYASLSALS